MEEIKLTKSQRKLLSYWQAEIMSMQGQIQGMFRMLGGRILSDLRADFAAELGVDTQAYQFDPKTMSFKKKKEEADETKA